MNIIIIGRRGLGKSSLAKFQADKLNPNQIWFDPGNQFHNVDLKTSDLHELQERLEDWPEDKPYVISYVPPTGNVEVHWNNFAAMLWSFVGQHPGAASFVLGIDEAHRIQSPQSINDWLDEFIRRSPRRERGDHNPIDLIQTTHLPQDLFRVSWSESDFVYFFNVFDKRALKAIDEQYGTKIPEIKELVSNLKSPRTGGREVLEVESETGAYRVITDPNEWYVDIKTAKPPANAVEATNRDIGEIYGSM
jgi:hypothetical protein